MTNFPPPTICDYTFHQLGRGLNMACLWVNEFSAPVSTIWYTGSGDQLTLCQTFTIVFYRRMGLMTHLFNRLVKAYPTLTHVITDDGTDDGGMAWLNARGFVWTPPAGYVYTVTASCTMTSNSVVLAGVGV
jgi:hypothetical protein